MRGRPKCLEYSDKNTAGSTPPLCKGPIPPIGGKCPEGTKGGGRWLGGSRDGGIVVVLPSPLEDNPSVSLTADSSLYTREPLILPAFGVSTPNPSVFPSSAPSGHLPPGEGWGIGFPPPGENQKRGPQPPFLPFQGCGVWGEGKSKSPLPNGALVPLPPRAKELAPRRERNPRVRRGEPLKTKHAPPSNPPKAVRFCVIC